MPRYRISPLVLLALLAASAAGAQPAAGAAALPTDWIYTIRPGDNLWTLGRTHLARPSTWPELQRHNRLLSADRLVPGMRLRIPFELMKVRPVPARVLQTGGLATVIRAQGERAALAADSWIDAGDIIETGADGSASVEFADESTMLIGSNARVVFDLLVRFGSTGMVDTRIRLDRGRARPDVMPSRGRFQIWSPALQVTTRGTEFRLESVADGATGRVEVTEGDVDASNAAGTVVVPQGSGTLARAGVAPAAPVALLEAPQPGPPAAPQRRLPVRLTVPQVVGAAAYRWEVGGDPSFRRLLVEVTSIPPTLQLPDLPDGAYPFRVRAIDGQGLEGLDGFGEVQIDARPEAPFLIAPAPAAVVRQERPGLTWTQPANAASFRVQISANAGFETTLVDAAAPIGRAFVPDAALEPGKYLWRVATRMADGDEGPFGDAQEFTVRRPPATPTAESPDVRTDTVVLRWSAADDPGTRYHAQLSQDPVFATIVSEHTLAEPQLSLSRPAAGAYYVRVRAIEADGFEGGFGAPQSFEVPPPPVEVPPAPEPKGRWWWWLLPAAAVVAGVAVLL